VLATSNGVEEMVGKVATCCKRKRPPRKDGPENLLRLLLTRKTGLDAYLGAT